MCIYISPICNVKARLLFREIIKIRDSLFSLLTWYQSQRENLIYFFSDRVSFRSLSSPLGTLRRWISSSPPQLLLLSPPPVTFRAALLWPEITDSEAHEADLHSGGNPAGNQHRTRRHTPPFSDSLLSTRRRVGVRGSFTGDRTPQPGSSGAVLLLHPSGTPPRALLIHLLAHFAFATLCQSSSPRFGSFFFFISSSTAVISSSTAVISSSTAVIRPPIRVLFNPNVIQSPVKWIWQLKILFLLLLSLDLLLSHQKN